MSAALALDHVAGIAADLAGAPVLRAVPVAGGRNSRVFRIETPAARYALKLYPARGEDARDRLGVEAAALRWMADQGLTCVPRVIAADPARNAMLLSWIAGARPRARITAADIAQACDFLRLLHARRATPALPRTCLAAEACLSGAAITEQVRGRIAVLRRLDEPALTAFLDRQVEPAFVERTARARAAIEAAGHAFDADLPPARQSQVPSDFGFHNALRGADARLAFLDFEYFGWDDPVKLAADLLLHPGTTLDAQARAALRTGLRDVHGDDPGFAARLAALLPLFALRWALILLNEFRPALWQRRVLAGAAAGESWDSVKQRQLAAASAMLHRPDAGDEA